MNSNLEGYRLPTQLHDRFTGAQKRLVEAWAYGNVQPTESSAYLGLTSETVKQTGKTVKKLMYDGPGTDRVAKAVSLSAQNGWLDHLDIPDENINRKLTENESLFLTFRAIGLTRGEIADQLAIPQTEVSENLDSVLQLLGTGSDYTAIAWAIKVLKNKQKQEQNKTDTFTI